MHWKSVLDHFVSDQVTIPEAFFMWVGVQLSQFPVHKSPFSRLLQLIKLGTVTILWVERVCSESEDEQTTLNVKKKVTEMLCDCVTARKRHANTLFRVLIITKQTVLH